MRNAATCPRADLKPGLREPSGDRRTEIWRTSARSRSGAGFDAFLAARQVGDVGSVIGVDMTAEMIAKARANIGKTDLRNVGFRPARSGNLPVADASVDVIHVQLRHQPVDRQPAACREAFRVLAPGGRLAISDIVAIHEIPEAVRNDLEAYAGCVSGAALVADVEALLGAAGFRDVRVDLEEQQCVNRGGVDSGSRVLGRLGFDSCNETVIGRRGSVTRRSGTHRMPFLRTVKT